MQTDSVSYSDLLPNSRSEQVSELLDELLDVSLSVVSTIPEGRATLSYSGGIDSSILAKLSSMSFDEGPPNLVTLGVKGSFDTKRLRGSSSADTVREIDRGLVEIGAEEVSKLVRVTSLPQFDDCVCFWLIANETIRGVRKKEILVTANGPDELYCGYDRFRRILDSEGYESVEQEISRALESADALKKEVGLVLGRFGLGSRDPFLEGPFRKFGLSKVPISMKILQGDDRLRKRIWRAFGRRIGVPETVVLQPKKAMQYSMGTHPIIKQMIKKGRIQIESRSGKVLRDSDHSQI
jgi:asparagine synthase (glutamine-hydrolysing)